MISTIDSSASGLQNARSALGSEKATACPSPMPLVVRVRGFAKSYGGQPAVKDVELEIHRGEIYGLIGPDGAGKSSLMKAIAGVLTYDAGEVEVFGLRIDTERAAEKIKGRMVCFR
jgi:ABC-2 type transport system ATP-binding protein